MIAARFFERSAVEVARDLVGAGIQVGGAGGIVVETEAYERDDPASHRLCQALGVDRTLDGQPLDRPPFALRGAAETLDVAAGPRIGISRATDRPWRFALRGSPYLSQRI